jgi:DNA helicase II / ATP-dependent DNA helicase PcrA
VTSPNEAAGRQVGRSTARRAQTPGHARPAPDSANIAPEIREHYPDLSEAQRAIVGHLAGPLLVIAGPGSGKTYSIVLRALNLLLLEKAQPRQLVLCTFTEKAAFEMRDRLAAAARKVGYA